MQYPPSKRARRTSPAGSSAAAQRIREAVETVVCEVLERRVFLSGPGAGDLPRGAVDAGDQIFVDKGLPWDHLYRSTLNIVVQFPKKMQSAVLQQRVTALRAATGPLAGYAAGQLLDDNFVVFKYAPPDGPVPTLQQLREAVGHRDGVVVVSPTFIDTSSGLLGVITNEVDVTFNDVTDAKKFFAKHGGQFTSHARTGIHVYSCYVRRGDALRELDLAKALTRDPLLRGSAPSFYSTISPSSLPSDYSAPVLRDVSDFALVPLQQ